MTWYHPKYYKELRKQYRDSIEALPRKGESLVPSKLQAANKRQATSKPEPVQVQETTSVKPQQTSSDKPQASSQNENRSSTPSLESSKLQASSPKQKGSSFKPQASSAKIPEPGNN